MEIFTDPKSLITLVGTLGIIAIIFAESGLFFAFFLPGGDSLLFTAGLLASQGFLPFETLIIGCTIAAILGDSVGYWFGKKVGPKLFTREESFFFKPSHVVRSQKFFENHGKKTLILARFIPIVRTFVPILAGVGKMPYKGFLAYNILGGVLWSAGFISLGFFLGSTVPGIEDFIVPIGLFVMGLSILPLVYHFLKRKTPRKLN